MMTRFLDEEEIRKRFDIAERKSQAMQFAARLITRGKQSFEEIAEDCGLSLDEVIEIAKNIGVVTA